MITKTNTRTISSKAHNGVSRAKESAREKTRARRKSRVKKLVRELYGGEPYEFYPLGKYIVAAPAVCRGRPTFKYTRVEITPIIQAMAGGWSVNDVVAFYQRPEISQPAVREAVRLAGAALVQSVSPQETA